MRTLVVCEKPDAAARVARAIDEESIPRKLKSQGVPYYECGTRHGTVIVCSALGHLYSIDSKGRSTRQSYPIWDNLWKPKNEVKRSYADSARWIRVIRALSGSADRFVNACDYDTEGSLIGFMILKRACNASASQSARMVFSTMTDSELKKAFRSAASELGLPLVEAARCRHELDWLYGINLSRVLTDSVVRENGGYTTLSTGRVQGPTLSFVVEREQEIGFFVPIPFWVIEATIQAEGQSYSIDYYVEKIPTIGQAEQVVRDCKGAFLTVREVETHPVEQKPPFPFDLSGLQSEAFRHFGFSPARTVAIAERLYLDALISYPRTASQKLPPTIGYQNILQGLSSQEKFRQLATRLLQKGPLRPSQGFKDDPAHPAVYPTGETPARSLADPEAKLYDLIVRRFFSTFADPALHQTQHVVLEKDPHMFYLRGSILEKPGWIEFYTPYASSEKVELPELKVGDQVPIISIRNREAFTKPPPRFSSLSLLRKMEDAGIGTKATRAEIIEILYKRGYIDESRMRATLLATTIVRLLGKYCPQIIDSKFTATVEESMEKIQEGGTTRKIVLVEAVQHLRSVMLELIAQEEALGGQLGGVVSSQKLVESSLKTPCPSCGGVLRMVRNRKTRKRFIGCAARWENNCRFTLPLPQFGSLSITDRTCKVCGFQMVQARTRGRRSTVSCPRCYADQHRERTRADSSGKGHLSSEKSVAAT